MGKAATNLLDTIRILPGYDPYDQAGECVFDADYALYILEFVEKCCTHVKGEKARNREPLILEPWQQAVFANLWGWKRPDGSRRFREAMVFIPRGNSKTTMAAAMVCVGLYLDDEPGAELYSSAAERDQARLCFDVVTGMIRNEPLMEQRAAMYKYSIVVGDKSYKALSAEAGSKHGFSPQLVVNDELHAHKSPELTEVLMTGTLKRTSPLVVHLTTSDYEREGSICNDKHDYATKVRDGVIDDPAFLPVIYEAGKDDDWMSPDVWAKANPNLHVSVPLDYLQRECNRAREDPSYENTFKRLHLNIRTESVSRWITTEKWDACVAAISLSDCEGMSCWCGFDIASTEDFNAFVIAVPQENGETWIFPFFWVPEATARRREQERRIPYDAWARAGLLTLMEGNCTDPARLHKDVMDIINRHKLNVYQIACDRAFQGLDVIQRLDVDEGIEVFAHGQGSMGMIPPTKMTKTAIFNKTLKHDGNKVLRWMIANTVVHPGEWREYPMKGKSPDKIDGVVAMVMAVGLAALGEGEGESFYENNEIEC